MLIAAIVLLSAGISASETIGNVTYTHQEVGEDKWNVTVRFDIIRQAEPDGTVYFVVVLKDDELWWFDDEEVISRKKVCVDLPWSPRADGRFQKSIELTFTCVSGASGTDWLVDGSCVCAAPCSAEDGNVQGSVHPESGLYIYDYLVENDPNSVAMDPGVTIVSAQVGSFAFTFVPPIPNGTSVVVSASHTRPPPVDHDPSEAVTVPYSLVFSNGASIGSFTIGPDPCEATIAEFNGNEINADVLIASPAAIGEVWTSTVTMGHFHGGTGVFSVKIRERIIDGPNFVSPIGGRLTEFLVGGRLFASVGGVHDGITGTSPPQTVPGSEVLCGLRWAAQATVVGGDHVDLSTAVFGTVGSDETVTPTCFTLDFETDDSGGTLTHGQRIDTEFDGGPNYPLTISSSSNLAGCGTIAGTASIFDSDASPVLNPDLAVGSGNILVLHADEDLSECSPGLFCTEDDDEDGGSVVFSFNVPVEPVSLDLIDVDDSGPDEAVTITLTDTSVRARIYEVPANWTGDITEGQPGVATLDLTSLASQPGFSGFATAVEDSGFDPDSVVSIVIERGGDCVASEGGSGAIDNLIWCQ